jgi:hypothetical protein
MGGRFDLILVDGGHDEISCRTDIANARGLAAPDAIVIVDDLMPHKAYGEGVVAGWEGVLDDGVLVDPVIWRAAVGAERPSRDGGEPTEGAERRWGVARYGGAG